MAKWTVAALVAALAELPADTLVSLDGCGCCADAVGVYFHPNLYGDGVPHATIGSEAEAA